MEYLYKDQYLEDVEIYLLNSSVDNPYSLLNNINVLIEQELDEGYTFDQIKTHLGSHEELANVYISQQLLKENSKLISDQDINNLNNELNESKAEHSFIDSIKESNKLTQADTIDNLENDDEKAINDSKLIDDSTSDFTKEANTSAIQNFNKEEKQKVQQSDNAYEMYKKQYKQGNVNNKEVTSTKSNSNIDNQTNDPQFSGGMNNKYINSNNDILKIILSILGIFILLRGCNSLHSINTFSRFNNEFDTSYLASISSTLTIVILVGVVVLLIYIFTKKDQ